MFVLKYLGFKININETVLFENIWNSRAQRSHENAAFRILKQSYQDVHCKS